jgi:hypothetical protein
MIVTLKYLDNRPTLRGLSTGSCNVLRTDRSAVSVRSNASTAQDNAGGQPRPGPFDRPRGDTVVTARHRGARCFTHCRRQVCVRPTGGTPRANPLGMSRNPSQKRQSRWQGFLNAKPVARLSSGILLVATLFAFQQLAASSYEQVEGSCFVAGTPVLTENGPQPIESITEGMRVWARDEFGVHEGWKTVLRTFVRQTDALVRLTLESASGGAATLEVTPNHPVFVVSRGWIAAGALVPGRDQLLDEQSAPVMVRVAERFEATRAVYNLEVADYRTYFAGELKIWAHNLCEAADGTAAQNPGPPVADLVPWRHD